MPWLPTVECHRKDRYRLKNREDQRKKRARYRASGCSECGAEKAPGKSLCRKHLTQLANRINRIYWNRKDAA